MKLARNSSRNPKWFDRGPHHAPAGPVARGDCAGSVSPQAAMCSGVMAILLAASACTTVLDTDFESKGGPWPSGALAGPPAGDSAQVQGQVLGLGGSVSLMSSSSARLDLITGGKPHHTDGYSIDFSGVKLTISDSPVIAIDALDAEGQLACGLEIAGGEFRLVSAEGTTVIGNYTGAADEHRVFLRLNLAAGTCGVRIEQFEQGAGPHAEQTVPLITANGTLVTDDFGELDRLRIRWEDTEGTSATQYFLAHVTITKDG